MFSLKTFKKTKQNIRGCSNIINLNHRISYYKQNKKEEWFSKNKHHRIDGPAIVMHFENGQLDKETWIVHGNYHRTTGPAVTWYWDNGLVFLQHWYFNNVNHRTDGPASIYYLEDGTLERVEWAISGKKYKQENGFYVIRYHRNGEIDNCKSR